MSEHEVTIDELRQQIRQQNARISDLERQCERLGTRTARCVDTITRLEDVRDRLLERNAEYLREIRRQTIVIRELGQRLEAKSPQDGVPA